jgi:hypothetical protein
MGGRKQQFIQVALDMQRASYVYLIYCQPVCYVPFIRTQARLLYN